MRAGVFCLLLAAALPVSGEPSGFCSVSGKMGDNWYEFRASEAEILRTPIWKADAEFPALSPRKAQEIARREMQKLLGSGKKQWAIRDTTIRYTHFGLHFVYVVEFEPPDESCTGCDFIRILVLMDGTVPKPIVKPMSET
jgi:hypothetical protein